MKTRQIIILLYVQVTLTLIIVIGVFAQGGFSFGLPTFQFDSTQVAPVIAEEPEHSNTPPPSPTWTPTLRPIPPTSTPSPAPTFTPMPPMGTPISSPTPLLTLSPSPTVTPTDTSIPPSATPTNTPTPSPTVPSLAPTITSTPASDIPTGMFTLLAPTPLPSSPDEPPLTYGPTNFEWEWVGVVPPELGFELRIWREGKPQVGAHNAVLDNSEGKIKLMGENRYRLSLDITETEGVRGRGGEYWWTVALVQVSPEYTDLGRQADPGLLRFVIPGGSSSDGGGGSDGGSNNDTTGGIK